MTEERQRWKCNARRYHLVRLTGHSADRRVKILELLEYVKGRHNGHQEIKRILGGLDTSYKGLVATLVKGYREC